VVPHVERLSREDQGLHEVRVVGAHPPIPFDKSVGALMAAKHLYGLRFRHGTWDYSSALRVRLHQRIVTVTGPPLL
jgi:hypothetical protein